MINVSEAVKVSCVLNLLRVAGGTPPVDATEIGLSEKLVFDIHNLTNREMSCLAQAHSSDIIDVNINIDRLEDLVGKVKRSSAEDNDALEFIKLGASTPLMVKLFGMQNSEVTALRKAMSIKTSLGGRPRCSIEERLDVLQFWHKFKELAERQRYLAVAKELNLSLKVVHMVVMQESNSSQPAYQFRRAIA